MYSNEPDLLSYQVDFQGWY